MTEKTLVALPPRRNKNPVRVSLTGRLISVPWGQEVEMPSEVVEILRRDVTRCSWARPWRLPSKTSEVAGLASPSLFR